MYRAFALKALRAGLPLEDSTGLETLAAETAIRLEPGEEENRVLLDGEDVTGQLRNHMVTDAASRVSVFPAIRAWMVGLQQQLGAAGGVVMEGRDIGTVVFPDADVKVFLDASPEARTQRRYEQNSGNGTVAADTSDVFRELRERDERDRGRANSPLHPAPEAVVIDSTTLSLAEVLERIEGLVRPLFARRGPMEKVS
jgi:cytidylate kinase